MNTLLLIVLASCPPGADPPYWQAPAPGPAYGDSSPQGRPRLFGWLRGHRHTTSPYAGNGPVSGGAAPPAPAPAPAVWTGPVVGAMPPEPAPSFVAPPAPAEPAARTCNCGGNGRAGGGGMPLAPAAGTGTVVGAMSPEPAPTFVPPPAPTEPAARLVARPQAVMTSAEPPLADPPAPAGAAPRLVPVPAR
jgi:hypothetical protein